MFTGLVEAIGMVRGVETTPAGRRIRIDPDGWDYVPEPGASVCVSGCCLTAVSIKDGFFDFDVIHRSLEMTTLGEFEPGSRVNLERSATLETLLGGHLVQGHVDGTGIVREVQEGGDWRMKVDAPPEVVPHLVDRGSITIDGTSLTIARVLRDPDGVVDGLEVALIPETLARTTLADRRPGDRVNLEADAMAKMIASHVERILADRGV